MHQLTARTCVHTHQTHRATALMAMMGFTGITVRSGLCWVSEKSAANQTEINSNGVKRVDRLQLQNAFNQCNCDGDCDDDCDDHDDEDKDKIADLAKYES